MNDADYNIIKSVAFTEKSVRICEGGNKCVFFSSKNIRKDRAKGMFERLFGVRVQKINSMICKGKTVRHKGVVGKRATRKKFIVTTDKVIDFSVVK